MTSRFLTAGRVLAVVLLLAISIGVASAEPAAAIGCDSRDAPSPKSPRSGISGFVAEPPAVVPTGDPFREDAEVTELFDKYGTAGLWFPVYDPGCNPATEMGLRYTNGIAGQGLQAQNFFLNASASVRSWAWRSDWLAPIDEAMTLFTSSVKGTYTGPMMGVALVVAGLFITLRGRRAELSDSATLAGWAVAMMVLGMLALSAPTKAAQLVDYYGAGTAQLIETAISGSEIDVPNDTRPPDAIDRPGNDSRYDLPSLTRANDPFIGLTTREVAYQNWLSGMFGSSDSATATEYGPRFYKAMALSWDEAALQGEEREQLEEQKREEFKTAAEELRDADPAAFQVMQGKTAWEDRVMPAWVSALLVAVITLFGFVAAICVLLARLVTRFGVMALPIVIPFGMVHQYRQPVVSLFKLIAGGILTAIMYTLASGLTVRLISAMLRSTMPLLLIVVISLGLTVVLLTKLRATQVIRTMVGVRVTRNLARSGSGSGGRRRFRSGGADRDDADEGAGRRVTVEPGIRREDRPAPILPDVSMAFPWSASPSASAAGFDDPAARRSIIGLGPALATGVGAGSGVGVGQGDRAARRAGRARPLTRVVTAAGTGPLIDPDAVGGSPVIEARAGDVTGDAKRAGRRDGSMGVGRTASDRNAGSSVWIMGPATAAGSSDRYYVPRSARREPEPDHRELVVYEDQVAELRDGRPVVPVFQPDPDRARPRTIDRRAERPKAPRPERPRPGHDRAGHDRADRSPANGERS